MTNSHSAIKVRVSDAEEVEVPVTFVMTNFLPSVVAQHMTIQGFGENFVLSFFELDLPFHIAPSPELLEEIKQAGYEAECVARVTIPKSRFIEFARVLGEVAGKLLPVESEEERDNTE